MMMNIAIFHSFTNESSLNNSIDPIFLFFSVCFMLIISTILSFCFLIFIFNLFFISRSIFYFNIKTHICLSHIEPIKQDENSLF